MEEVEAVMNLSTHGLHMTWPQGMVSMAFRPLERPFLQEGQIRTGVVDLSEETEEGDLDVLKVTGIRVLRDMW